VTQSCTHENLEFWEAVQQYKTITSERVRKERAMEIYIKHMGAGAPCEIEADPAFKSVVKKNLLKPTVDIFDKLQEAAFETMNSTSYLQFTIKSSNTPVTTAPGILQRAINENVCICACVRVCVRACVY
jgi:hypothetical protein